MPRNRELMREFRDLKLVEQLGSGIHRILKAYNKDIFKMSDNFMEISFPYEKEYLNKEGGQIGGQMSGQIELVERLVEGLVESQKKIVILVAENPKISKKDMSEKIGISTTAIDKNIEALKKKNIIKRVGSDRSGSWQIMYPSN
jgi:predicted HTH transcriptional regulator